MSRELLDRVERDFTLHPPKTELLGQSMDMIRAKFKELALFCAGSLITGREQSVCISKLEEACFYAIASIARSEENL